MATREPPDWATGPHDDVADWVEIRPNEDGTIDEIVTHRPVRFHLEQIDEGQFFIGLSSDDPNDSQCLILTRKGRFIYPTVYR